MQKAVKNSARNVLSFSPESASHFHMNLRHPMTTSWFHHKCSFILLLEITPGLKMLLVDDPEDEINRQSQWQLLEALWCGGMVGLWSKMPPQVEDPSPTSPIHQYSPTIFAEHIPNERKRKPSEDFGVHFLYFPFLGAASEAASRIRTEGELETVGRGSRRWARCLGDLPTSYQPVTVQI